MTDTNITFKLGCGNGFFTNIKVSDTSYVNIFFSGTEENSIEFFANILKNKKCEFKQPDDYQIVYNPDNKKFTIQNLFVFVKKNYVCHTYTVNYTDTVRDNLVDELKKYIFDLIKTQDDY